MIQVYKLAWAKLQEAVEGKLTWGKNEIRNQMAICLQEALDECVQMERQEGRNIG